MGAPAAPQHQGRARTAASPGPGASCLPGCPGLVAGPGAGVGLSSPRSSQQPQGDLKASNSPSACGRGRVGSGGGGCSYFSRQGSVIAIIFIIPWLCLLPVLGRTWFCGGGDGDSCRGTTLWDAPPLPSPALCGCHLHLEVVVCRPVLWPPCPPCGGAA